MSRILIATHLHDIHATAVALALERKGHEAVLWHGADFPTKQQGSFEISNEEPWSWNLSGSDLDLVDPKFDTVWVRRPAFSVLPDDLHSGDRHVAKRACDAFLRAAWAVISPEAFWVNPTTTRVRASSKPVQLIEAVRSGLSIPPTLCGNEPEKIRRFLGQHEGNVIFKPMVANAWKNDDGIALSLTNDVTVDQLPEEDILRLSPGIFQRKIAKSHELRVNYMGDFSVASKILSQDDPKTETDWRMGFKSLNIQPDKPLPKAIDAACRALMLRLGIVFGCFDFIVTPEGDYIFLEVNEMGQFLWLEELNPEILLLDSFTEFLIHGARDFAWRPRPNSLKFKDVHQEAVMKQKEIDTRVHVQKTFHHSADDHGRRPDGIAPPDEPTYESAEKNDP